MPLAVMCILCNDTVAGKQYVFPFPCLQGDPSAAPYANESAAGTPPPTVHF